MTKAPPSTCNFEIEVADRIDLVQRDWDALMRAGQHTPFQSRNWLEPWYAIVGPHFGSRPLFVIVRDHDSHAPMMLLPLCLRRQGLLKIIEFDPAYAVKITMRRPIGSGALGESDVYGAQQHVPLMEHAVAWEDA